MRSDPVLKDIPVIFLEFDHIRIGQVIRNYVSNAIRYSPGEIEIEVRFVESGGGIHLIMKDSGRGIDPSELENVFLPFYRTGDRVGRVQQGSVFPW